MASYLCSASSPGVLLELLVSGNGFLLLGPAGHFLLLELSPAARQAPVLFMGNQRSDLSLVIIKEMSCYLLLRKFNLHPSPLLSVTNYLILGLTPWQGDFSH